MSERKQPYVFWWLSVLPTQALLFVGAWCAFVGTVVVCLHRIAHGHGLPDGAEGLLWATLAGLGVERAGSIGKRATEWKPTEVAKAAVIAADAPPTTITSGPPTATVAPAPKVGPLTPLAGEEGP